MTVTLSSQMIALRGRRVLVVEDEYMIAEEIASILREAGAEMLGPVPRVGDSMRLIDAEDLIDCTLLDINLQSEAVWPVVDALLARDIPLLLSTGYTSGAIPRAYAHLPRREKPISRLDLAHTLARMLVCRIPGAG